jgi:thiosulfate dehydrogenase [quinone] large subunit
LSSAPILAPGRGSRAIVAATRIVVGLVWLSNTGWKEPPAFGERGNRDLYRFTRAAVDEPVFPPYSWLVEHLVLPNFRFFGWLVLLLEIALGAFLTFGIATRLWAVVGAVHAVLIALTVVRLRGEWPWAYYLMIVANLVLFATMAGRFAGIDGVVRPELERSEGRVARWWMRFS